MRYHVNEVFNYLCYDISFKINFISNIIELKKFPESVLTEQINGFLQEILKESSSSYKNIFALFIEYHLGIEELVRISDGPICKTIQELMIIVRKTLAKLMSKNGWPSRPEKKSDIDHAILFKLPSWFIKSYENHTKPDIGLLKKIRAKQNVEIDSTMQIFSNDLKCQICSFFVQKKYDVTRRNKYMIRFK